MAQSESDSLLVDAGQASQYVCPGETVPVSRAIHLARIHAAWPGCDQCQWRDDAEGSSTASQRQLAQIREHRSTGIRRTEFGVRGVWNNQLDRQTASALIRVFCDAIFRAGAAKPTGSPATDARRSGTADDQPKQLQRRPIVIGFDGRTSSLDLFVGISSAIREFGLPVMDIGRCTAASVLEAVRCFDEAQAAVIVTGSGGAPAVTGFDVFEDTGDPVAVRWNDYGIHVVMPGTPAESDARSPQTSSGLDGASPASTAPRRCLDFEDVNGLPTAMRASRDFGVHRHVAFEDRYRSALMRWFPRDSTRPMVILSEDAAVRERVRWISAECRLNLSCARKHDSDAHPYDAPRIDVSEDDREFQLFDRSGKRVPANMLADRINGAIRSGSAQITAHADQVTDRFWLTDAGRPTSQSGNEHVTDALATAGLLLKLADDGMSLG
jgi:Phosphoglucomutase/phosphomannomutase, alpha/beta/alpha domain I